MTIHKLMNASPVSADIEIHMGDLPSSGLTTLGIDTECETVDLFAE